MDFMNRMLPETREALNKHPHILRAILAGRERVQSMVDLLLAHESTIITDDSQRWCESPIEQMFLAAWRLHLLSRQIDMLPFIGQGMGQQTLHYHGVNQLDYFKRELEPGSPIYSLVDWKEPASGMTRTFTLTSPQVAIGEYRVDFLIGRIFRDSDAYPDVQIRQLPFLVVECDGHEFHEKTKEQAARDKARDRFLQREGFHVMRFTGSELNADPMKCAAEVDTFFNKREPKGRYIFGDEQGGQP